MTFDKSSLAYTGRVFAKTNKSGIVQLATTAEAQAGTSTERVMTPANTASYMSSNYSYATQTETDTGTATDKVVSPATLAGYLDDRLQVATVTVSSAELLALAATPKELVAAPGADTALMLDSIMIELVYNSAAYVVAGGDDLLVKYENGSGAAASASIETTGLLDATADTMIAAQAATWTIGVASSSIQNKALVLHNVGSEVTTGDSPLTVKVFYRVVDFS